MVRDLAKVPEHNGRLGRIVDWDGNSARFQVALESPQIVVSVKRQNITQLCTITIDGVESKPGLNGVRARICSYDSARCRYTIQLGKPSSNTLALQPSNCIIPAGIAVLLKGLSEVQYNGQMAVIVDVDPSARRYTVNCQNGCVIKVKYENVLC